MTDFPIRVIINPGPAVAGARRVRKELTGVATRATALTKVLRSVFAFAGLGIGLNQLKKFSDGFIEIQNRLRIAGFATEELNAATEKLIAISIQTRSPLEANAKLLGRIGIAANDLGASQEDMFRVIELVGKGLAVQGSSAQEARGAIIQLSQAFGSGTVRAEEFNSVAEGAAPILQAVAKSMGVTFSQLKRLVAGGKVASKEFFQALIDGGAQLDAQFAKVTPTVSQVFEVINSVLTSLVGTLEQNFGLLSNIAGGLLAFAGTLPVVVPVLLDIAAAIVAMRLAVFAQGLLLAATSAGSFAASITVLGARIPFVTGAVTALTTALNFLRANPIIALITAFGLLVTIMFQFGDSMAVTADGTITLGNIMRGLAAVLTDLVGSFGAAAAAAFAFFAVLGAAQVFGINTAIGAMVVNIFNMARGFIAARAAALWLNPFAAVVAAAAFAIFQVVDAVFKFKAELIALFPPAQAFFDFIDSAISAAVNLWNKLSKAVRKVAEALNIAGKAGADAGAQIARGGSAAASGMEKAKKAAQSTAQAYKSTASGIATDFASASNSASGSLGTLARNAASSANSIASSMRKASSAVAGVKFGGGSSSRGLVGTGTGTSINTGGSKTASIGISSGAKQIAAAVGGHAEFLSAGIDNLTGAFRATVGITGQDNFRQQELASLVQNVVSQTGQAPTRAQQNIIEELAQQTASIKKAQGFAALPESIKRRVGELTGGVDTGGAGGLGGKTLQNQLINQARLQKQLDSLLQPPADALATAAVNFESATANLDNVANAPIWLTGNPFEAFRQNVFGFARGGSGIVGGSGGADSQMVNLALTPGELVSVKTPAQQREEEKNAGTVVTQNVTFNIETTDADSFGRNQTQIIGKTLNSLNSVQRRL